MALDFPRVGETVANRFRIDAVLARGGMGLIFRATQIALDRPVALKVLLPSQLGDSESERRFLREIEIIQGMVHPNIVQIFDHGTHGELLYIAMELLEGVDLSDYLKENGPLNQAHIYEFSEQVLGALCVAHRRGIVHRDIKASNVFVNRLESKTEIIKLLDFGIARSMQDDAGLTGTGNVCGTTAYMAPEILLGGKLSLAVDVYALGLLIAEMALGRRVVAGTSIGHHLAAHTRGRVSLPSPLSDTRLEAIVVKACNRRVELRYSNAMEMLADLRAAAPQCDPTLKIPKLVAEGFHILPNELMGEVPHFEETATRSASREEVEAFRSASMPSPHGNREDLQVPSLTDLDEEPGLEVESKGLEGENPNPVAQERIFSSDDEAARDGTAWKLILSAVCMAVLVATLLWGWISYSGPTDELLWTSGEDVVEAMKDGGWTLAPATVEQSGQREVWRIVAFRAGTSVVVRVFICGESSTPCFDTGGKGTWLERSGMAIQVLEGPGADVEAVNSAVKVLASDTESL